MGTGPARPAARRATARTIRLAVIAAAAAGLLPASAPPVVAASVDRTWTARFEGFAEARLVALTSGTGSLTITISGSPAAESWTPTLVAGTCRRPARRIATIRDVATDSTGAGGRTVAVSASRLSLAWDSTWTYGTFTLRLASASGNRCAEFWFVRATRVVVSGLGIDLPVIPGGDAVQCNVAMYLKQASQPQEPGVTFIYAHARTGMFLPLLSASLVKGGATLLGRTVYVYTSDSRRFRYRVTAVRRAQTSLGRVLDLGSRQLWLQTSEGPFATSTKLVVVALPVGAPVAVSAAEARPVPRPLACR